MLIGISGKIKSGKDTLAMMLQAMSLTGAYDTTLQKDPIGYARIYEGRPNEKGGWQIKKFADKLKKIVALLTGCNLADLEKQEFKASYADPIWNRTAKDALGWLNHRLHADREYFMLTTKSDDEILGRAIELGFHVRRTYRELLTDIGTGALRNHFMEKVWIQALFADYKEVKPLGGFKNNLHAIQPTKYPDWIISDMRFPDEADHIKSMGGILVRLNRYPANVVTMPADGDFKEEPFDINNPRHLDLWKAECSQQHISETALDNYEGFDVVISNDGTLEELLGKARNLVTKYNLI